MRVLVVSKELMGVLTLLLIGVSCISSVSAVMISSPNVVQPGEKIDLYLGNLDEDNVIEVTIDGVAKVSDQEKFFIRINDFYPEFSLKQVNLDLNMKSLMPRSKSVLCAERVSTGASTCPSDLVNADGVSDIKIGVGDGSYDIPQGEVLLMNITGTANSPEIPMNFEFKGLVGSNPPPLSMVSFSVLGISNAVFDVTAKINNEITEQKTITIQDSSLAS